MPIETIHHKPIVYKIYEHLKNYVGEENAISAKALAAHFGIEERALRTHIHTIRTSTELRKIIGTTPDGYYICKNKEEAERATHTFYSTALSYLEVVRAQEKKAGLDGQMLIRLGEFYNDTFKAFGDAN